MQKYIVVATYDFDPDSVAYEFDDYDKALGFMKALWKWCCEEERRVGSFGKSSFSEEMSHCNMEEGTAVITWDDGELTHRYFEIISTSEPLKLPDWCYND